MFEKSLTSLIKGLRSHRGKDEPKYIADRVQEIRHEVKSADMEVKAEAVLKLAYLRMLGYEVQSASFSILETMASSQYHIKHIGYLAAALCFSEETEVLILATNLIKKVGAPTHRQDLHSAQPLDVLAALNGLSHIINQELAQHLSDDVARMLTHTKPHVRKRAVLVLHAAIVRCPDIIDRVWERLRDLLCDPNQGVVSATVNAICELARQHPEPFVPLSPQLFEILTHTHNNWLVIKVVKLFGALARVEPRLVRKLMRPISDLISTTPAMSVLYECIHTAIIGGMLESDGNEELALRCVDNLGQFLGDTDQNLKYIALVALTKLAPTHPTLVAQHEEPILAAIWHPDMTIRIRALDLVCQLAPSGSFRTILETLTHYVEEMDGSIATRNASSALQAALDGNATYAAPETLMSTDTDERTSFRIQVSESILELGSAETYAHVPDMAWYLATLRRLAYVVDLPVAPHVADQIMDVVWRFASLRPDTCFYFEQVLLHGNESLFDRTSPMHETFRAGAWICSEYPELIESPARLARLLLEDRVRDLPPRTVAVCIQSAMKLCAHYAVSLSKTWNAENRNELDQLVTYLGTQLGPLAQHQDSDVQERARESLQLFTLLQKDLASHEPLSATTPTNPSGDSVEGVWDDQAEEKMHTGPRALHLLQPLFFMREEDENEDEPLPVLPPSFDLHAWIVPHEAWGSMLEYIEPQPKPKVQRTGRTSNTEPKRTFRRKDSRRSQKSQDVHTPPPPAEDDDVNSIPIVQLNLSDFTSPTKNKTGPQPDTPATVPAVQPKVVTRKKKPHHASR